MNLLGTPGNTTSLGVFKDPFKKGSITKVKIEMNSTQSFMRNGHYGEAVVWFKNGDTSGDQTFYSNDFDDLMNQVKIFIASLKTL